MSVEVLNESGDAVDERALVALSRHVLDSMQVSPLVELCVRLVDVATMTELHEKWMDEPGPTDVLAFPMDELTTPHRGGPGGDAPDAEPTLLGDVVLCPEVAKRQAREAGHGAEDELHILCTHGVLHLLGYDHHEPDEEREMFALQGRLVAEWRDARDVLLAALRPADGAPAVGEAGP